MKIILTIEMHNYWHCGSGLAAGADMDALVIKDKDGLPYIPGKTIKGLIREAVDTLLQVDKQEVKEYDATFGYFADKDSRLCAASYFKNATLSEEEANQIIKSGLQRFLYTSIANTAIDTETETAKEHSLRKIEVSMPCTLHCEILDVPESMADILIRSIGLIKNLGVNRNRGLGRCTWKGAKE